MAASPKYPFTMLWTGYTDEELIREANTSLNGFDRADVLELVRELARRFGEVLDLHEYD